MQVASVYRTHTASVLLAERFLRNHGFQAHTIPADNTSGADYIRQYTAAKVASARAGGDTSEASVNHLPNATTQQIKVPSGRVSSNLRQVSETLRNEEKLCTSARNCTIHPSNILHEVHLMKPKTRIPSFPYTFQQTRNPSGARDASRALDKHFHSVHAERRGNSASTFHVRQTMGQRCRCSFSDSRRRC